MKNNETQNENRKYKYIVYIQFEESKKAYTFGSDIPYKEQDMVVVETVRGKELGKVCSDSILFDAKKVKGILKPVLRLATEYDLIQKNENDEKAKKAMKICHQCIENLELDMHLISGEYTLDRSKVIFTYVSEIWLVSYTVALSFARLDQEIKLKWLVVWETAEWKLVVRDSLPTLKQFPSIWLKISF